jgi:hypothetical protein
MTYVEVEAAIARFDADLQSAASAGAAVDVKDLSRQAVTAYWCALNFAAGCPFDPRWRVLMLTVEAFIVAVGDRPHARRADGALERLALLCDDSPILVAEVKLTIATRGDSFEQHTRAAHGKKCLGGVRRARFSAPQGRDPRTIYGELHVQRF